MPSEADIFWPIIVFHLISTFHHLLSFQGHIIACLARLVVTARTQISKRKLVLNKGAYPISPILLQTQWMYLPGIKDIRECVRRFPCNPTSSYKYTSPSVHESWAG